MADQPVRLCIVSRDRLHGADFIAALRESVRPEDHLEIIVDRRHVGLSAEADLEDDRRRQHQVYSALEANGFAIIPASVDSKQGGSELFLVRPEAPTEHLFPEDDVDEDNIHSLQQPPSDTLMPKLLGVLSGVTLAVLVLLLARVTIEENFIDRLFAGLPSGAPDQPPGQADQSFSFARSSAVTEQPAVPETRSARTDTSLAQPNSEPAAADGPGRTRSVSPRDDNSPASRRRDTSPTSEATNTASRGRR